jgi:hypothetical protein
VFFVAFVQGTSFGQHNIVKEGDVSTLFYDAVCFEPHRFGRKNSPSKRMHEKTLHTAFRGLVWASQLHQKKPWAA